MIETLKKLFSQQDVVEKTEQLTQPQREALLDLLLLGMYADNMLSLAENQFIDYEMDELTWESSTSPSAYLSTAFHKIRVAEGDTEKRKALIQNIGQRLGEKSNQQGALQVLENLFAVDGTVEEEHTLLGEIRNIFGI